MSNGMLQVILLAFIQITFSAATLAAEFSESKQSIAAPTEKEFNFLIYYAGDNNLGGFMESSVKRVIREGGTKKAHVLIQYDGIKTNDSFRISVDEDGVKTHAKNLEYNMGDPKTLNDFVKWGISNYPSKKTILLVFAHGRGPINLPVNDGTHFGTDKTSSKILALASSSDEGSESYMNEEDLVNLLKKTLDGKKLDLFIYNSCLMGNLEVMGLISEIANFAVASPYTIYVKALDDLIQNQGRGILIEKVLHSLKTEPSASPREIGMEIVAEYDRNYKDYKFPVQSEVEVESELPATMSFYDLRKFDTFAKKYSEMMGQFENCIRESLECLHRFYSLHLTSEYVDNLGYVDILTLADSILKSSFVESVAKNKMAELNRQMKELVLSETHVQVSSPKPYGGISIYFPKIDTDKDMISTYFPFYLNIRSVRQMEANRLLTTFWSMNPVEREKMWLSYLNQWANGENPVVTSLVNDQKYNEYSLFLNLDVHAIRISQSEGPEGLRRYLSKLKSIERRSEHLDLHTNYVNNLLRNSSN